jgi:hypothetical protein
MSPIQSTATRAYKTRRARIAGWRVLPAKEPYIARKRALYYPQKSRAYKTRKARIAGGPS